MTYLKGVQKYNDEDNLYLHGNESDDDSLRLYRDGSLIVIEKKTDGIWQPSSLETGPNSLWVGPNVGVAALGHHLATESGDGHLHFLAHSEFENGLTTTDSQILYAYDYIENSIIQPDDSSEWSGTSLRFSIIPQTHTLLDVLSVKTGSIAATEQIKLLVRTDNPNNGTIVLNQDYPASYFTADSSVNLSLAGKVEFDASIAFYFEYSSSEIFSLKTNSSGTWPWAMISYSSIREDSLLQTTPYVDGDMFSEGQYLIDSRKIYICNSTGLQTGTFASNVSMWDELASTKDVSTENYWNRGNYNLYPKDESDYLEIQKVQGYPGMDLILQTGVSGGQFIQLQSKTLVTENIFVTEDNKLGIGLQSNVDPSYAAHIRGQSRTSTGMFIESPTWADPSDAVKIELGDANNHIGAVATTGLRLESNWGTRIFQGATERFQVASDHTELFSPDGSGILTLDNTLFQYTDGSSLLPRMKISDTQNSFYAPNGSNHLLVNNAGLFYTVGIASTGLTDTTFTYHDGFRTRMSFDPDNIKLIAYDGSERFKTDSTQTYIKSVNGLAGLQINNNQQTILGADGAPKFSAQIGATWMYSPNGTFSFQVANAYSTIWDGTRERMKVQSGDTFLAGPDGKKISVSATAFAYHDGTRNRLEANTTESKLLSPDGIRIVSVTNDDVAISDYTRDRFLVNNTATYSVSPDGGQVLQVENGSVLTKGIFRANDHTRDRIVVDGANTQSFSPDGNNNITVNNTGFTVNDGTRDRIEITNTNSNLISPNGGMSVSVTNSIIDNQTTWFNIGDGVRTRFRTNTDDVQMHSPNGVSTLAVSNTGTVITGATEVCAGNQNKSFTIHSYDASFSGASMTLKGTWLSPTVTSSNYAIDNFWGYMRIYTGYTGPKYIRMSNVGGGDTDLMHLNVDGGILAGVESGFKTASAGIELRSTKEAILLSRMTTSERDALTAQNGMMVYNTTTNQFNFYENGSWVTK